MVSHAFFVVIMIKQLFIVYVDLKFSICKAINWVVSVNCCLLLAIAYTTLEYLLLNVKLVLVKYTFLTNKLEGK